MAGVLPLHRKAAWNIRINCAKDELFAGFYQHDNLLTVADVAHDLSLCFSPYESGHDDNDGQQGWQHGLLPKGSGFFLALEEANTAKFPTPAPDSKDEYRYVLHDPSCRRPMDNHHLQDSCIRPVDRPRRRHDRRYLPIGKPSSDPMLALAPMRGTRKRTRTDSNSASPSPSPDRSVSPHKRDQDGAPVDAIPNAIINTATAKSFISNFRTNVISASEARCVITGKGKYWCPTAPNIVGPGTQAVHIVSQLHWSNFPVHNETVIVDQTDVASLQEAWMATWDAGNGLLMGSNLHQCYDARLFAIHPDTGVIRAFVPYDILLDYHGKTAYLPLDVNRRALRFHYDMCCIENMAAVMPLVANPVVTTTGNVKSSGNTRLPPVDSRPAAVSGDPDKPKQQQSSAALPAASTSQPQPRSHGKCQQSIEIPPSPTVSRGSSQWEERPRLWQVGSLRISDPKQAELLGLKGWIVREIASADEDGDEKRGRPWKRKRLNSVCQHDLTPPL